MKAWTREERYQPMEAVSPVTLEAMKEQVAESPYRQTFHIQPETGLLNDPNGLIYYDGEYYISHQWFPLGAVHGLKYWFNYRSRDLVHFEPHGVILKPDTEYDSHGVYSGSAFEYQGRLYYMYTGNHRDEDWTRTSSQLIAKMEDDGTLTKFPKPVIAGSPEGYTQHFRDPKVFQRGDTYYAIIGAQTEDEAGRLLLYKSTDIVKWEFHGEVHTRLDAFGYMWECPDYFELDGHDFVMFCPQGIESDGERYRNIYQSGYLIGQFDIEQLEFNHGDFLELDHGFDFYAPQTFTSEDGERVLIGWMGLPDTAYPTDEDEWAHCLTVPRTLHIEDGKLKQRPIVNLQKLRTNEETALGYANKFNRKLQPYEGKQYELIIDILENEATELYFELRASKTQSTLITYNTRTQQLTLDRSESGPLPEPVDGTTRSTVLDTPLKQLQIFVDTSSIEIFCNDGERVLTSRIFPDSEATGIKASTESGQVYLKFTKYDLEENV
ncbi:sucrose-6-phosphate hydrolase [Staphylococcus pettenkoferi]|uniref:sucrose-6-phosphate hydrolase n=1 Tax=Staphylococcus pettenkoferi TaxID=170573 RepID=UPI00066A9D3A|nr:sucrose-6-phosphate hydrolase [Staphylococcus pettenkoferi]MCI2804303.1 sucrose-6-phosphate hydrolase [Staphylococcus pettenkoferi]MCY1574708.1 sucrose-6-phosphate hydrolase [Staphylococcus pettenkoferi]MCY1578238.1 sucrose-6-phosphate hydrolase [Staphylococcus pettenkoferi]MCY1584953.1 sucrose-6-phosphate hydrolase [Staphylococcus pettenkoferi]MCY1616324.1 sucrose-6-phosphate hydrolase [Staphylococcus pettenkoferi]